MTTSTAPLVSIYIPTKNRQRLLERAVCSLLGQTERRIEVIVVSDGCTDGTCDYVRGIVSDIPVRLIHNEQSGGACAARNQALAIAQGEFVTGLDDDDFFAPHRIALFLERWLQLEQDNVAFSCLFDTCIVDDGRKVFVNNPSARVTAAEIRSANLIGNQIFTRRDRLIEAGMYDPQMPAWQDWETWVRVLDRFGPAINVRANTYFMDTSHEFDRITMRSGDKIRNAAQLFYRKHCQPADRHGLLLSMSGYAQVSITLADAVNLLMGGRFREAGRKLLRGKTVMSLQSSLQS